jgi:hypothetical protein
MYVTDGIAVWKSGVQRSIVTAGSSTVVLLGQDMLSRGPGALRAASCTVPQHGVELDFGDSELIQCQLTWLTGDWWVWCSPDVVDGVVAYLALETRRANEVRTFREEGVDRSTATGDFDAGDLQTGSLGRGREQRDSVQQAILPTVHQEVEEEEEVGPNRKVVCSNHVGVTNMGSHGMFLLCGITHGMLVMALKRGVLMTMFMLVLKRGGLVTMRVHGAMHGHDEDRWDRPR